MPDISKNFANKILLFTTSLVKQNYMIYYEGIIKINEIFQPKTQYRN